jgi:hypothetical protein
MVVRDRPYAAVVARWANSASSSSILWDHAGHGGSIGWMSWSSSPIITTPGSGVARVYLR